MHTSRRGRRASGSGAPALPDLEAVWRGYAAAMAIRAARHPVRGRHVADVGLEHRAAALGRRRADGR
jgi:hypothetical protein